MGVRKAFTKGADEAVETAVSKALNVETMSVAETRKQSAVKNALSSAARGAGQAIVNKHMTARRLPDTPDDDIPDVEDEYEP